MSASIASSMQLKNLRQKSSETQTQLHLNARLAEERHEGWSVENSHRKREIFTFSPPVKTTWNRCMRRVWHGSLTPCLPDGGAALETQVQTGPGHNVADLHATTRDQDRSCPLLPDEAAILATRPRDRDPCDCLWCDYNRRTLRTVSSHHRWGTKPESLGDRCNTRWESSGGLIARYSSFRTSNFLSSHVFLSYHISYWPTRRCQRLVQFPTNDAHK
jgi:hypothetical protein